MARTWSFGGRERLLALSLVGVLSWGFAACSDEKDKTPPVAEDECVSASECGLAEYCVEGVCQDVGTCSGPAQWSRCADRVDGAEMGMGALYACIEQVCTRQCELDSECAGENEICSDYGKCVPYLGTVDEFVATEGSPSALRVGVGQEILKYPIGLSLGGYGSRMRDNDGPYASGISASQGQIGAQFARSIWLENEENALILVRVPIIFPTGYIHELVARNLQELYGEDFRDELVIVGTHTHSGPGRHWRLPKEAFLDLGMLGTGAFFQPAEDWLVESITASVVAAYENLQPGKLGWKIVEAYDIDDVVGRDRWSSTPHFDLNRLLLIRLDNAAGEPLAAVISYGSHGTDNSSDYATDDVVGGAEIGLSAALSEEFGRYIPTLYMPEAGGSMSHASGTQGHRFPHSVERAGGVMIEKALASFMAISTNEEVGFRSRTYRFPLNYDLIGYERGEFGNRTSRPLGGEFRFGALLCGGPDADDDDFATSIPVASLNCTSLTLLLHNRVPTLLMRAAVTAIELDGLSIVTMPGEATQEIGWQALARLRDEFSVPTSQSWVLSYAQTHLLYLSPTNLRGPKPDLAGYVGDAPDSYPDHAFSFLQGGYEPGMTPWGPKSGDYIIERVADAFAWLTEGRAPRIEAILPDQYARLDEAPVPVHPTSASDAGTIVEDVDSVIRFFEPGTFAWVGGDPGAEMPQAPLVALERFDGDEFVPVVLSDHRTYTNREPLIATRLRIEADQRYVWEIYYDLRPDDLSPGTYRFNVLGHRLDEATNARVSYATQSAEFEVPMWRKVVQLEIGSVGEAAEAELFFPLIEALQMDVDGERAKLGGHLRPSNWLTPTGIEPSFDCSSYSIAACHEDTTPNNHLIELRTDYVSAAGRQGVPVTSVRFTRALESAPETVAVQVGPGAEFVFEISH